VVESEDCGHCAVEGWAAGLGRRGGKVGGKGGVHLVEKLDALEGGFVYGYHF